MSSDLLRQIEQETLRAGERRRAANSLGFCALQEVERRHEQHDCVLVRRDPCPRCNVRGDIGCAHQPSFQATPFHADLRLVSKRRAV